MHFIAQLYDDPINFFKKKRNFKDGLMWMLAAMLIFVVLNQAMIQLGFIKYEQNIGALEAAAINYFTIILGYFVITCVTFAPYRAVGGKKLSELLKIVAYSLIPMVLLWIPHIVPQAIVMALILILMTRGIAITSKASKEKAMMVTGFFVLLVIILSIAVNNYIFIYF